MDTDQISQPSKDRRQESASPPPRKEPIQQVLRGFEHLAVPYPLQKVPKPAKAPRQRRSRQVKQERVAPRPDQLSLPLRAV